MMIPTISRSAIKELSSVFLFVYALLLLAGCGGGGSDKSSLQDQSLSFAQPSPAAIAVSQMLDNPATGVGTGVISYSSSNTSIATVDNNGTVTAIAAGDVTISATIAADATYRSANASYSLEVIENPSSLVFLSAGPIGMVVGDVFSNAAISSSAGAISYSSSNSSIADVDSSGQVTAYAAGSVTITANQVADGIYPAYSASYQINIVVSSFTISAWMGESDTQLDFSPGVDGIELYRSTDAECNLANYMLCSNGQLDILDGTTVIDTAANASRSAFYNFVYGGVQTDLTFAVQELVFSGGMEVVEFKGKLFAIGGDSSPNSGVGDDVWVSNDGIHWALLTNAAGFTERKEFGLAVFDDKLWIVGGWVPGPSTLGFFNDEASDVWFTSDGINWTEAVSSGPFGNRVRPNLISFNGKFWLFGGYRLSDADLSDVWSSSDGINWTEEVADLGFIPRQVVEFNSKLYITTNQGILSSSDGVSWTEDTPATGYNRADGLAVHQGKLWVVSYESSTVSETWSSPDGTNWTQEPVYQSYKLRYGFDLLSFNNRLFMLGGFYLFSAQIEDHWFLQDGRWQRAVPGAQFRERIRHSGVTFDNKLWVIAGKSYGDNYLNDVWSSSDGITWTEATANAAFSARNAQQVVEFNSKLWLYGGENGSGDLSDAWSSTDGINWSSETADALLATRKEYGLIVFNDTLWMLGGIMTSDDSYTDEVWYSADGTSWAQATGSNFPVRSKMALAVYNGSLWMVAGESSFNTYENDVWYSSDGVNWTQATADAGCLARAFVQLYVQGGKLHVTAGATLADSSGYAASSNCGLWSTSNGVTWTEENTDSMNQLFHNPIVELNGDVWMLGGSTEDWRNGVDYGKTIWRTTDGANWRRPQQVTLSR